MDLEELKKKFPVGTRVYHVNRKDISVVRDYRHLGVWMLVVSCDGGGGSANFYPNLCRSVDDIQRAERLRAALLEWI